MRPRAITTLLVFVVLCLAVGAIGGIATASSVTTWYPALRKPAWTPPGSWFAPVWTALYVFVGVAGWRVWDAQPGPGRRRALVLWCVQLALNAAWSPLFFGLRNPGLALVEIVLLAISIAAFVVAARHVSRAATLLFVPYAAWVGFATALNAAIWWLNRG